MRKTLVASLAVLSVVACAASVMAIGSGKTIEIRKAAAAVVIDGDLKEFAGATGAQIGVLKVDGSALEAGAIDDDADWSSMFYGLYDDKNIYLAFDVKDDALAGSAAEGNIWQNDGVEIWFDANNDDAESTETGSVDTDQHQIVVSPILEDEPGKTGHNIYRTQDGADLLDGVKQGTKISATGWTLEVLIPIAALHADFKALKAGQKLGFNISIVDNDTGDWNHLTWNGTQHNNPQGFGIMAVK